MLSWSSSPSFFSSAGASPSFLASSPSAPSEADGGGGGAEACGRFSC